MQRSEVLGTVRAMSEPSLLYGNTLKESMYAGTAVVASLTLCMGCTLEGETYKGKRKQIGKEEHGKREKSLQKLSTSIVEPFRRLLKNAESLNALQDIQGHNR